MDTFSTAVAAACLALCASGAWAQDPMKKGDAMAKDGMMKKEMTSQECKDHMAMRKKEGVKKDDAMMKKDAECAAMMKKDGMAKDDMMMKDGAASAPMMKK
jgi:hypothetical protein